MNRDLRVYNTCSLYVQHLCVCDTLVLVASPAVLIDLSTHYFRELVENHHDRYGAAVRINSIVDMIPVPGTW